jgi:hypothetical protein
MSRIIALSAVGLAAATMGLARIVGRAEQRQAAPPPAPRPPAPPAPELVREPAPELVPAPIAAAELALPVKRGARGRFESKRKAPPAAAAT